MKGIVFNLLEQVVVNTHGEAAWDGLLDKTGLTGAYTSLGSYPDAQPELEAELAAQARALSYSPKANAGGFTIWTRRP